MPPEKNETAKCSERGAQRYIALHVTPFPFRGSAIAFHVKSANEPVRVDDHLLPILESCSTLKTVKEHARLAHSRLSGTIDTRAIEREIEGFIKKGLLIPEDDILARMTANAAGGTAGRISHLGWVTHGRIGELAASVESFADHAAKYGRNFHFIVCDDSGTAAGDFAAVLPERVLHREGGIRFFGRSEKAALLGRLTKDVGEGDAIAFMLGNSFGQPNTCGANRNALSLATAGYGFLSIDDDVTSDTYALPDREKGISFTKETLPFTVAYFPDRISLESTVPREEIDIIAAHETLLGKSAGDLVRENPDAVILDDADPRLIARLTDRTCMVRVTMAGLAGSSGMGSPGSILMVEGTTRDRVLASEETYAACIGSNEVLRSSSVAKVSDSIFLMGYNIGLDNRDMLPPFFPFGRSSDAVFATLARKIGRDDLTGYLPFSVMHDPRKLKTFEPADIFNFHIHISDIVIMIVKSCPIPDIYSARETRLVMLGNHFKELAGLGHLELVHYLKTEYARQLSGYIRHLESLLRMHGGIPRFWADDVYRTIDMIDSAIDDPCHIFPVELRNTDSPALKESLLKEILLAFGRMLTVWPEVFRQAKNYNQEDICFHSRLGHG